MRIELIEETLKMTGEKRYSVEANGQYVDGTVTRDIKTAEASYQRCIDLAVLYPADTKKAIHTTIIGEKVNAEKVS